jgi:hypothetical protein
MTQAASPTTAAPAQPALAAHVRAPVMSRRRVPAPVTSRLRAAVRVPRVPAPVTSRPSAAARVPRVRAADGQAAVELVAILPCAAALLAALWQLALVGHAMWAAATAARAAARAQAVGHDPRQAARDHLPASLERDLRLSSRGTGEVEVEVRIPTLPGVPSLGHTGATGHFTPQS